MADLSDVMAGLVTQVVAAVYPSGTTQASATGAPTTVYPGWPIATVLDADLSAMFSAIKHGAGPTNGRVHVSVFTNNVEQNITKSLDGWQDVGTASGGLQPTAKEVRRVKRQFMITIYAPTPQLRDLTGSLIDVALCSLRNLSLADGTVGQIYYVSTMLDDAPSKEYIYSRKSLYAVEYGTFATQNSPLVTEVQVNALGGYDPENVLKVIFNPDMGTNGPASGHFSIGLNVSGMEDGNGIGVAGVDYAVPTTAEIDYYKVSGLTKLRLPFLWERIQPTLLGALDTAYLGYIQALVTYGASIGVKFLLDVHNYGGRSVNGVPHKLGDGVLTPAHFADLWTKLATVFVGSSGVYGYDIMNEPSNMPNPQAWPLAAQACVDAIRTADMTTTIYCEGDGYSGAGAWLVNNANLSIVDPANNLIYSAHMYPDRDSSGSHQSWVTENSVPVETPPNAGAQHTVDIGVERVAPFAEWLEAHGFKGHIGEVGVATDQDVDPTDTNTYNANYRTDGWNVCLDRTLAYCQSKGIPVTYWNAGPYSIGYYYGVEATKLNGVTVPTKEMAVLEKYANPAVKNHVALLIGPTRGAPGAVSTRFILDVRGNIAGGVYTPTSDVNGVTFTPASITLPGDFNGLATFTLTAPSTPLVARVGVTCPTGVTPPALIGYSTKTDVFSNLSVLPVNIYSADWIYTPYIGPLLKVYKASDTAMVSPMDFYPTVLATDGVTYTVDQAAIAAFAGTTGRVFYYDQSPHGFHQVPITDYDNGNGASGAALPHSLSDLPVLVANSQNGKPAVNRTGTRVDAISPIDGHASFGWFSVCKPSSVAGMQNYFGWQFIDYYAVCGDANGDWQMSDEPSPLLNIDADATAFHAYSGGYSVGASNVWEVFRDTLQVASATPSSSVISYRYRNNLRIGYAPFSQNYSSLLDAELIIFDRAPSHADHQALHASAQSRWATPVPPAQVTGVTLGAVTATTQALSWTAVGAATGYTVQYRVSGSPTWAVAANNVVATNYTVSGLLATTSYDYRVIAVAGYGVGPASASVTGSTTAYPAGPGLKLGSIGVNVSGLENYPYPIAPSQADLAYYAAKGFKIIRLPFDQKQAMPVLGGPLSNTYMSMVDSAVTYATGLGLQVDLDCHDYSYFAGQVTVAAPVAIGANSITLTAAPDSYLSGVGISGTGTANGTTATLSAGNATITLSAVTTAAISAGSVITMSGQLGSTIADAAFTDFWNKVATRHAHNSLVTFGLQNEPQVYAGSVWARVCNAGISGINAAETAAGVAAHTIYVPFPGYNAGSATAAGLPFIQAITDYLNPRYRYEAHQYNDGNGSGTSPDVASLTVGAERISSITQVARLAGVKLVLGEFAVGADGLNTSTPALACLDNELGLVQNNADVWDAVCWWGGGDFGSVLNGSYYYGITPFNGQDTPWIPYLRAFMPGGAKYGYTQVVKVYPLALFGAMFGPASATGFGQGLTGGYAGQYSPFAGCPVFTIDWQGSIPAGVTIPNPYGDGSAIVGMDVYDTIGYLGVDGTGHAVVTDRSPSISSGVSIQNGATHTMRYSSDGTHIYLFVDGVLVGQSTAIVTASNPAGTGLFNIANFKNDSRRVFPGNTDYVAIWGKSFGSANYTPTTTPLSGNEQGLIVVWNLDGDGMGYA